MILQRWQTVYLLVAAAAMIVFLLNPVATIHVNDVVLQFDTTHVQAVNKGADTLPQGCNTIWLAISGWVAVALAAAAVVTFRKLKLQKSLACLCGLISAAVALLTIYVVLFCFEGSYAVWHWTAFLPFLTSIMGWMAFFAIRRDKNIIESADRLWD